jgi:hypothetical protein
MYTGMRKIDVYNTYSDNLTFIEGTPSQPRSLQAIISRNKSDPSGSGPEHFRTYLLPCTCLETLGQDEKKVFVKELKKNMLTRCVTDCPFKAIYFDYLLQLPDPFGEIRNRDIVTDPTLPRLKFMRAQTTGGPNKSRYFLVQPLGEHSMKACIGRLNLR